MSKVYVLELSDNKFYVGKTNDVDRRFQEHMNGYNVGSAWTRKYKPISIKERINDCDCLDEDKITVKYMMKYGISNVRGGPYVSVTLSPEIIDHITMRIRMASDLCSNCGSSEHFISECKKNKISIEGSCMKCLSITHFTEDCEVSYKKNKRSSQTYTRFKQQS